MSRIKYIIFSIVIVLLFSACSKFDAGTDYEPTDPPPVPGGFINSAEIAPDDLIVYFPFDGNLQDSMGTINGLEEIGTSSFTEGRKGMAYQAAADGSGYLSYADPGAVADLKSFTVAFWINTQKHVGGAQSVFMLTREGPYTWGNFFVLIEGNDRSNNKMQLKLHFENANATYLEHWIDPGDALWPDDMYGSWRHVIYTYDENTSTAARYISGNLTALPDNVAKRIASGDFPGGPLLGPLAFQQTDKFLIGAFQSKLGSPYNAPDTWMLNYTGKLDEFRIYNRALTAQEASALYILERQGR